MTSNARELAQIPNTLKVDSANNRVGIGTTSPAHELTIQTTSSTLRFVFMPIRIHLPFQPLSLCVGLMTLLGLIFTVTLE